MRKEYIKPLIKGHKIIIPSLLSLSDPDEDGIPAGGEAGVVHSKRSTYTSSYFEDEIISPSSKEKDFAYGL